jgi:hypothetical protein
MQRKSDLGQQRNSLRGLHDVPLQLRPTLTAEHCGNVISGVRRV